MESFHLIYYNDNSFFFFFFLGQEEAKLETNTLLYMSLRLSFLAASSIHSIAGIWFAIACLNRTVKDNGCYVYSWAYHHSKIVALFYLGLNNSYSFSVCLTWTLGNMVESLA